MTAMHRFETLAARVECSDDLTAYLVAIPGGCLLALPNGPCVLVPDGLSFSSSDRWELYLTARGVLMPESRELAEVIFNYRKPERLLTTSEGPVPEESNQSICQD